MNFSDSKDEGLLSLWESVRRQVLANRANGGRCRFAGDNLRAWSEYKYQWSLSLVREHLDAFLYVMENPAVPLFSRA
jgi:hypothetical protein